MTIQKILDVVRDSHEVEDEEQLAKQHGLLQLLESQLTDSRIILYASAHDGGSLFVHSMLVPTSSIACDWDGLTEWQGNPFDLPGCGLVYGGSEGPRIEYTPQYWADSQLQALSGAEQLVFGRSFEGRMGEQNYFELAQCLTLAHNLHWLDERQAWCRLNNEGDIVELAGIENTERAMSGRGAILVWIDREILELHMSATDTCLAQMFDSTRIPDNFHGIDGDENVVVDKVARIVYKCCVDGAASYFRGVQFIRPNKTATELGEIEYARERSPKEYETFLIHDFKNGRLVECSCDPSAMASYFEVDSVLPFQTSPVFFKPDVLDKYKADPDKYRLDERTISCRNSWHLQTYDVNEAGQVHTMIRYLGYLPVSEQRYWRSFNEAPKASISKRSFKTDFEGEFDLEPDGLRDLKGVLTKLGEVNYSWFTLRQPQLVSQLHYPLTGSTKTWDDILIGLAKCAVEGLDKRYLMKVAKDGGRTGEQSWGSIKWLREALLARGVDEDRCDEIVGPFSEIQSLRSKLAAHSNGAKAVEVRQGLLKEFGSPRKHIEIISTQLEQSFNALISLLEA